MAGYPLLLHLGHGVGCLLQQFGQRMCLVGLGDFQFGLLALDGGQFGCESRGLLLVCRLAQFGLNGPVFLGHEFPDLVFALHDYSQGHGLDAPGREPTSDLLPEERADFVADQSVQNAPGLLGIDQIHVDLTRVLEGVLDGFFGDFVEFHAVSRRALQLGGLDEMPGDGFAFPVRVGGQIYRRSLRGRVFDFLNDGLLALGHDIPGDYPLGQRDAQGLLRQIAHVSHGRLDGVLASHDLAQRSGLRRGFNNNEVLLSHFVQLNSGCSSYRPPAWPAP